MVESLEIAVVTNVSFTQEGNPAADSHAEFPVIAELGQYWGGEFAAGYVFGLAKMSDGTYMAVSPLNGLQIEITLPNTLEIKVGRHTS
jgi:hypothetical protein